MITEFDLAATQTDRVLPVRVDVEQRWWQAAEAALTLGEHRLVRELCDLMLSYRPQHLDAHYYQARLALLLNDLGRAQPLLEQTLLRDPEHWPARWALGVLLLQRGEPEMGVARCHEAATGHSGFLSSFRRSPEEQAIWDAAWQRLRNAVEPSLSVSAPHKEDVASQMLRDTLYLEELWCQQRVREGRSFAVELLERYPRLVKPRLLLAEWLTQGGELAEGASHLHDARVADPGGHVARRLGGSLVIAAYSSSPPDALATYLQKLPAAINQAIERGAVWQAPAAIQLPRIAGKRKSTDGELSPQVKEIRQKLDKLQTQIYSHLSPTARTDLATAETLVVVRKPLVRLYGDAVADTIIKELASLTATIRSSGTVLPRLLVLDDAATLEKWHLEPLTRINAATINTLLDRLDGRMEEAGERMAYVLLVGGHEIIPHHRLPNPVDDHDMDVPSDNPYASRGENYLIPTRAVGRLPHEHESPDLLLSQIRYLRNAWWDYASTGKGFMGDLLANLRHMLLLQATLPPGESWGLSAEVWARAAKAVYRTLDAKSELRLSPPATADDWEKEPLPALPFYYFNLHGVEDGASWYGQSKPSKSIDEAVFPVALTPTQLKQHLLQRAILFTEACYGANPHVTQAEDSMALTAIKAGCTLFVGSTNTSYASFAPPLMAADLLAAYFWKAIADGAPGGIALQRAKLQMAETTMRRTGYLDVEEQKSLISFILYGDPAFPLGHRPRHADPEALRHLAAKTSEEGLYQVSTKRLPEQSLNSKVLQQVRQLAEPYLLGTRAGLALRAHPFALTDAPPWLNEQRRNPRAKQVPYGQDQWHVTVTSIEEEQGILHRQVLTMKVDKRGKVLRTHTSR